MKKRIWKLLLTGVLAIGGNIAFAQVSPYSISPDWYFGQGARLAFPVGDFPISGAPVPGSVPTTTAFGVEASTGISHRDGTIAFYTNTVHAYNGDPANAAWTDFIRDFNNSGDNTCAGSCTGGAVAFPDPASPDDTYYLVLGNDMTGGNCQFRGINVYQFSGTGTNVTYLSGPNQIQASGPDFSGEALTVGNDGNGGYWLIVHAHTAVNTFRVWHFTASGITGPTDYTPSANVAVTTNTQSYLKINACQDRIAYHSGATIVVHEFDRTTGAVGAELRRVATSPIENGTGLEFSPDGQRVYHNGLGGGTGGAVTYFEVATGTTGNVPGATSWSLQLGPDGNIYTSPTGNNVGMISDPNNSPSYSTIALPGGASVFRGLKNMAWLSPEEPVIDTVVNCLAVDFSYVFQNYFLTDIDTAAVRWDFGEGAGFETGLGANPSHTYASNGNYEVILEITDTYCGQLWYDTIDVVLNCPTCPPVTASIDPDALAYCEDDSVKLSALPQDPTYSYQWLLNGTPIAGATDSVHYATSPGDYEVVLDYGCDDDTSAIVAITENPKPATPVITGTTPVCPGDSGGYKVPTGFASYTWGVPGGSTLLNGQNTDTITVEYASTAGNITLVVTNGFGCPSDEATLTVTMSSFPAAPVIVGKDLICPDQQDVGYEIQSPTGGSTYNWSITGGAIDFNGNDTISVDYGSTAPFMVEVSETNASGCSSPVTQLAVDTLLVSIATSGIACAGQPVTLTASTNGDSIGTVQWYLNGAIVPAIDGGDANPLVVTTGGNYSVEVFDPNVPCTSTSVVVPVTFNPSPTSDIGPLPGTDTLTINLGETVDLTGTPGGGTSPYNTVWLELTDGSTNTLDTKTGITSPVDLNGLLPFDQSDNIIEYVFNVTDDNGCFATDTMRITVLQVDVMIPNIITPNGDNSNQTFEIVGILPGSTVAIFNRWGKQIYMSENYDNTWQADEQSDGIYYVNIKMGITEEEYKGWVYVVR